MNKVSIPIHVLSCPLLNQYKGVWLLDHVLKNVFSWKKWTMCVFVRTANPFSKVAALLYIPVGKGWGLGVPRSSPAVSGLGVLWFQQCHCFNLCFSDGGIRRASFSCTFSRCSSLWWEFVCWLVGFKHSSCLSKSLIFIHVLTVPQCWAYLSPLSLQQCLQRQCSHARWLLLEPYSLFVSMLPGQLGVLPCVILP